MAAFSTIALLTLSAAKTAYSFVEQRKEATAIQKQGDFEAMLYGRNADQADKQAADAIARGEEGASDIHRSADLLHGSQRATLAATGVDINSGSALAVQQNDSALATLDMARVRTNAAREAAGYTAEGETYRMEGGFTRDAARTRAKSIRNQSVGTLLEGVGQLANIYQSAPKGISRVGGIPEARNYVSSIDTSKFNIPRYSF